MLYEVITTMLAAYKQDTYDYAGAEAAFKRAIQLSPNYARAYHWYGWMLRHILGRITSYNVCYTNLLRDEVAYVRFASVYRQFRDINEFMAELTDILAKGTAKPPQGSSVGED